MTDREIMQQALDALEVLNGAKTVDGIFIYTTDEIFALRQALAQPEQDKLLVDLIQEQRAEIDRLRQALAQPEQKLNDPPAYVEPPTSDYHNGWEEGFEAAKNLFKKESAPQNADPRLLLVRKDNCTALAQPEQEPQLSDAGADTSITRGLEPKGSGMVTLHQPVAWMMPDYGDVLSASEADGTGIYNIPLYTAPPKPEPKSISTNDHLCAMLRQVHDVLACTALPIKRPWVGLTDDEIKEVLGLNETPWSLSGVALQHVMDDVRALEAKLKEKNGG